MGRFPATPPDGRTELAKTAGWIIVAAGKVPAQPVRLSSRARSPGGNASSSPALCSTTSSTANRSCSRSP